jgi:flagellar basal body-associated protein FliL
MSTNAENTEKDEGEGKARPQNSSEGKSNKVLFIGIIAAVLVLNTIVAFLLIQATRPKDLEKEKEKMRADSLKMVVESSTEMGATTEEEPIEAIVNIAGTDGERFLKASVIFEYDDQKYPELAEELVRRGPKFKSILMTYLSKLTLVEVTEPEAKERISKEILRLVNNTLPHETGVIREVMFTSFIIQ